MMKKIIIAFFIMFSALLFLGFFLHTAINDLSVIEPMQGQQYDGRSIEAVLAEGKITMLPDFVYSGDDPYLKLVYDIYSFREFNDQACFFVLSARVFDTYEEADRMNVFATVMFVYYNLYGNILVKDKIAVEPVCITFTKNPDSSYEYYHIKRAQKGNGFQHSVKDFCRMPITGKYLPHIAEQMLSHYNNYGDLLELQRANLVEHLQGLGLKGVSLYLPNAGKPLVVPLT